MPQEPRHPGKDAKPNHIIQLNCREMRTYASYKATRTWENFNNQGAEMIFLPEELGSIANNSKKFTNGSKSIIQSNLGLYKHSDIVMDLMVQKYRLARKDVSNKLMIFGSDRK